MSNDRREGQSLRLFFDDRASQLSDDPDWAELCFASGREPRLWTQPDLYDDLMQSIREQLEVEPHHTLLEVGSAAGFLAKGLAQMSLRYTGVDIAPVAVARAKRLGIANATFRTADATNLPFPENHFDRAICHDVFTNFSNFDPGRRIIQEMVRVVKPGGRLMMGSIPDDASKDEFQKKVCEVSAELDRKYGPIPQPPSFRPGILTRLRHWYLRRIKKTEPLILCYYFDKRDFEALGAESRLDTVLEDIHELNPYRGYRFNVIYTKKAA